MLTWSNIALGSLENFPDPKGAEQIAQLKTNIYIYIDLFIYI